MPKFIVTADTHFSAYSGSPLTSDGHNQMLANIVEAMDAVLRSAVDHEASIIHCGDFFHDRKAIKPEVLHYAGGWLQRVREAGVELHVLVGNHDLSLSGDGTTSANILQTYAEVYGAFTPKKWPAGPLFCFLPYAVNAEEVREWTKAYPLGSILIAHLGIGDPKYAACVPTDYEVPGSINVSDLHPERFSQVFLGHYHHGQQLTDNVRYVGSPLQLSFKETCEDKGWILYDSDTNRVTHIPNTISPRFHKLPAEAATKLDLRKIVGPRDHLWLTDATDDTMDATRVSLAGHTQAVVRIDKVRPPAQDATRADIDTSSNRALCETYIRAASPGVDAETLDRRAKLGVNLLSVSR